MLKRFEDKTTQQLEQFYDYMAGYLAERKMQDDPDCPYARFVREKLPEAWRRCLIKCGYEQCI